MTMTDYPKFKACAAHVAPVFLDAAATVEKACSLIAEAASNGAGLIAFPESYRSRISGLGVDTSADQEPRFFQAAGRKFGRSSGA